MIEINLQMFECTYLPFEHLPKKNAKVQNIFLIIKRPIFLEPPADGISNICNLFWQMFEHFDN